MKRKDTKIYFVGSKPPCGIGTFTGNLERAVRSAGQETEIIPVISNGNNGDGNVNGYVYSKFGIDKDDVRDYRGIASYISGEVSDGRAVSLQFEHGIYGGNGGEHVLELVMGLRVPVVTTLHTVESSPPEDRKRVVQKLMASSEAVVVMSRYAPGILERGYDVDTSNVTVIPHGVHASNLTKEEAKEMFGWQKRRVIISHGLLSRGKKIEYAIEAMPGVVEENPEVLYVVMGRTHKNILKEEGETYRNVLKERVKRLGLQDNVRFIDEYMESQEMHDRLRAADYYLNLQPNSDQITSGTLTEAVANGAVAISTPFVHAIEIAEQGAAILLSTTTPHAAEVRRVINKVLSDHKLEERLRARSESVGKRMDWGIVGQEYAQLFDRVAPREARVIA